MQRHASRPDLQYCLQAGHLHVEAVQLLEDGVPQLAVHQLHRGVGGGGGMKGRGGASSWRNSAHQALRVRQAGSSVL